MELTYLKDYATPKVVIDNCELKVDIFDEHALVICSLQYKSEVTELFLDGEELELVWIQIDGKALDKKNYSVDSKGLSLRDIPLSGKLTYQVQINPWFNKHFSGFYHSGDMLVTQCEAEGFRRITFFPDRPDVLTTYTVTMRACRTKYPVLLSNGNFVSKALLEDNRHEKVFFDPHPKPCYLFAMVAGDLAHVKSSFTTSSGEHVDLLLHTEKADLNKTEFALDALKLSMDWDEKVYGLEYDLDAFHIVATKHFNMGAMENKGLNIFNSKFILGAKHTVSDQDYKNIMAIVAHEYFHNWTGNRVTLRDWFQLSLKEGLTVFREQQFMEDLLGVEQSRIDDVKRLQSLQFTEDSSAFSHPVRPTSYSAIDNFYTATVYEKGAEVIRILQELVGDKVFNRSVRRYLKQFDGTAATIEDWLSVFEAESGKSLEQFKLWYEKSGLMTLEVSDLGESVQVKQTHKSNEAFVIPLKYQWWDIDAGYSKIESCWFDKEAIEFKKPDSKSVLLINHAFTAPAVIKNTLPIEALDHALLYQSDSLLTWQLMQEKWFYWILDKKGQLGAQDRECFIGLLTSRQKNPALLASLLQLPSYEYMVTKVQLDAVEYTQITQNLRFELAHIGIDIFKKILSSDLVNDFTPSSIARRSLIAQSLSYFGFTEHGVGVISEFMELDSMTYKTAALEAISLQKYNQGLDEVLDKYLDEFKDDSLALLPYLKTMALYGHESSWVKVESLLEASFFDKTSPNQIASLLGTLFGKNYLFIHNHCDSFNIWSQWVEHFDKKNPQLAARLVGIYKGVNCWSQIRQEKIAPIIKTLLSKVSHKQTYEMLEKLDAGI